MLKVTRTEIDLILDQEMHDFVDRGFHGGVSFAMNLYLKANNCQCKDYNPTKPESWILLLDANNLYGWAMRQALPYSEFEWSQETFSKEKILNLDDQSDTGYMFEVSLSYPQYLHDEHSQ